MIPVLLSGTKIVSVAYGEDSVVVDQDLEGVTSMDLDPPVGMVCLYRWLGRVGVDSFPCFPYKKIELIKEFYQNLVNHGGDAEW